MLGAVQSSFGCLRRNSLMALGFAAAFTGDWFLAIRRCGVRESGFLAGMAAFACAHLLWSAANWKESKVAWKVLPVVLLPLLGFFMARIQGRIPVAVFFAALAYSVISACSLAVAIGTRRWSYSFGIGCLVVSDVFLACRWVRAPVWGEFVGPTYVLALLLVLTSLVLGSRERRFDCGKVNPLPVTVTGGVLSAGFFVWAMAVCPGGGYNPLMRMLSYLGRTEIRGHAYPLSHYLFCIGMTFGAAASLYFMPYFRAFAKGSMRKAVVGWGMAVCVSGLLLIMMVPENTSMFWHNAGCYLAAGGGGAVAISLLTDRMGWLCGAWMLMTVIVFQVALCLDLLDVIPFAPAVPSAQKLIIASFMLWQLVYALDWRVRNERKSS